MTLQTHCAKGPSTCPQVISDGMSVSERIAYVCIGLYRALCWLAETVLNDFLLLQPAAHTSTVGQSFSPACICRYLSPSSSYHRRRYLPAYLSNTGIIIRLPVRYNTHQLSATRQQPWSLPVDTRGHLRRHIVPFETFIIHAVHRLVIDWVPLLALWIFHRHDVCIDLPWFNRENFTVESIKVGQCRRHDGQRPNS